MALRLMHLFEELNKLGTTIVIATHNETLVKRLGHPCLHVDGGRLVSDRPEQFLKSRGPAGDGRGAGPSPSPRTLGILS